MILPWIILIFVFGAVLAWASARFGSRWARFVSLAVLTGHMGLLVAIWLRHVREIELTSAGPWLLQYSAAWIPALNIRFSLALDGVSLLLVVLSNFLTLIAVGASWSSVQERVGFFHFNLLFIMAALAGLFMATDLFLFYVCWEVLLVPLYFLIALWGYEEKRTYAAVKFFIFTQASGLLLLVAILGLHFAHARATGVRTFDYFALIGTPVSPREGWWLMLGFFVAFAVKLPMVPLHTWLPDAHAEAPTAGSVDLAGLVLKVGAYGLLRFIFPLFPEAGARIAPAAMALGIVGILYGAVVAFGQTDLKRLVAYTSISHMGFVLLGIFSWNTLALQGAMMIMLAHAVSTGALFILAGDLSARLHTRELDQMGGLWSIAPRMGGAGMLFAMASLGLPGLGNFAGEFLVLLGAWQASPAAASVATVGFVVSTVYSLRMIQRVFHGPNVRGWRVRDMSLREGAIMAVMMAVLLWLGLYPRTELDTARKSLEGMQAASRRAAPASAGAPAEGQGTEAAR